MSLLDQLGLNVLLLLLKISMVGLIWVSAHSLFLSIDEKSQIQALDRTQPSLPIKPGLTHD